MSRPVFNMRAGTTPCYQQVLVAWHRRSFTWQSGELSTCARIARSVSPGSVRRRKKFIVEDEESLSQSMSWSRFLVKFLMDSGWLE